ncbi:MAG: SUMF1/EgtB/PvdO family nonheme iron enzyme [Tannerella sp.]|nr:SUMF1/EgtB/PvdO family nonheme iron enzyme [Tannerella sp.]
MNQSSFKELQPGATLQGGKYIIERVIGSGGFGITYYVHHPVLKMFFAVKEFFISGYCVRNTHDRTVLLQGISGEMYEEYRQKFIEEARTLAKLDHPNVVKVIDIFSENNTSYMVMPFLEGQTLQQLVEREGRLHYVTAVNYIAQLSEATEYIHQRDILHRDIKPDNIIITPDNKAILIEFGSAREFVHDKTQAHTSFVTQGYAPPEQYSTNSRKGAYSDIYSLGAVFYFALTGQKPVDAAARIMEPLPAPKELVPSIPDEANHTIMKAMELKPENRQQQVEEFMDDLLTLNPGQPVPPLKRPVKGKWKRNLGIAAIAVINIILVGIVLWQTDEVVKRKKARQEQLAQEQRPDDIQMVLVRGGAFTMGYTSEQGNDCWDYEKPAHRVTVSDFYIGKYEVTQAQWQAVMGSNPSDFKGDNLPVEQVSWDDVQEFIRKLNAQTGKNYRLPTEAEWEYAARGGAQSRGYKYSGSNTVGNVAWYNGNSGAATHPVGQKSPNELGLHDMSGNVWEWCSDRYDFYSSNSQTNPAGPSSGSYRVGRGGGWGNYAQFVRVPYRSGDTPDNRDFYLGFRLASGSK